MDFWVFLRPIPTENAVISWKLPTGDARISQCWVFKTIFCKEVGQKNNKKLPENVKKLENFQFFQNIQFSKAHRNNKFARALSV